MSSISSAIEYNLKANFEVLSDFAFLIDEILYLASPLAGTSLRKLKFKCLRPDHDGVCEEEGTPQLSFLHFKEIAEKNRELKENFKYLTEEVFYRPVKIQEREVAELLRNCHVNLNQFVRGGQRAVEKFKPVKNLFEFAYTAQKKLYYYLEVCSGVFGEAIVESDGFRRVFRGPLRIVWENLGLHAKQIGGSRAYFDKNGNLTEMIIEIEHRKRKPATEYLQYIIGFTDNLIGDFPMMDVNINTIPIALLFGEVTEIPRGAAVACPEARKDMMKAVSPILKIERGFMEEVGRIDVEKAENVGTEAKRLFETCSRSDLDFWRYRGAYVDKGFEFLDALTILAEGRKYPLFPEKWTGIRKYLERLRHTSSITTGKELIEKTADTMRKYSAEFPK
jgi:hypothetical protein